MGFVKIVQVDKFMILSIKNVYVIKLKIIIGIMFNVFSVIIHSIGILEILNVSFVLISKFIILCNGLVNIALHPILTTMEISALYVLTTCSTILTYTNVFPARITKYITQIRWYANVLVIIHSILLRDAFNATFQTISTPHLELAYLVKRTFSSTLAQVDVSHALLINQSLLTQFVQYVLTIPTTTKP